ncbi:LacI family transcriptional regulator [Hujiaoplasma nucleasis]|uniref:LacI family transcriptional regulator n=1 Tax=Hujiaoplasma nucleasis TaxID=2725268 RepID=A0A7L6N276_9MOLU|nr:LacI family DNA-binding transcriptional regulator [Hujiaoplasma nucleasis]QLY39542.1 LacI family transcriptional regulator [Hujiaoplasma nucleasis]
MVTIKDISKKSGVSVATVSKAINNYPDISEKTKKNILKLAKEMGYVPNSSARSLKTHQSYTIGIIFEEITDYGLQHPLFSKILESYKKVVESKGYDIMFLAKNMGNQQGSYLQHSMRKQVDAILVLCEDFNSEEMLELYQSDLPIIVIDYAVSTAVTVTSNNIQGMEQGVKFLVDLGHKKIAHVYGDPYTFIGGQRKLAFENALHKYNLSLRDDYLVSGEYFSKEDGYRAMQKLMTLEDQPTAVFCASDMIAIGAIQAIKEAGKSVPEDYSILGFDGIDIGQLITPKLTTIRQDARKMGEIAARKTFQFLDHPNTKQNGDIITVETYLINGDSTRVLKD